MLMDDPIIETHDIVKTFPQERGLKKLFGGKRKVVLDGISLRIRRNEIFGLLGPNGAGKTTLIKILCTLVRPTSGAAFLAGYDVVRQGAQARQYIGLVNCDDRSHFWRLSARENLRFYAALSKVPADRAERRIDELLDLTGLTEAANVRLSDFSSGMKQRLAVARGLLADPEILFMDEPSRSLDPVGAYDLRSFVRDRLVQDSRRTVVLATNLMEEATFMCDRLALIHHGKVQAQGALDELRYALSTGERYRLTLRHLSPPVRDRVRSLPEVATARFEPIDSDAEDLHLLVRKGSAGLPKTIRTLVEGGCDIWRCEPLTFSLEDVFRAVVSGQQFQQPQEAEASSVAATPERELLTC